MSLPLHDRFPALDHPMLGVIIFTTMSKLYEKGRPALTQQLNSEGVGSGNIDICSRQAGQSCPIYGFDSAILERHSRALRTVVRLSRETEFLY